MEGWKRTHRWGAGTLEAYVRGVDLDRLGLEEKSGAPFVPVVCGRYQSCGSVLGTTSIPESSPESSSAITRGAWASTRGCGARHATRTRVPSSAGRRHSQRRRAPCSKLWGHGAVSGERRVGGEATEAPGAATTRAPTRGMRRRTSGLRQLTLPPRPISRLSSASLPSLAALYTASPIESLIASAALYRPSPARTPADWGGHAAPL